MDKEQILEALKDASEGELVEAIIAMIDDDWINDAKLIAQMIQSLTASLVDQIEDSNSQK